MRLASKILLLVIVQSTSFALGLGDHRSAAQEESELERHTSRHQQMPMEKGTSPSHVNTKDGDGPSGDSNLLTISDILPQSRKINIFASLTRDVSSVYGRLESNEAINNTTLLAPLNSAMQALPRKPWEDRPGDNSGVSAASNEDKAAQNLQRFVEEHVIPVSPWLSGPENKVTTMGGQDLWWKEEDGHKMIMPRGVVVDEVVGTVGNGAIWALRGIINYA